MKYLFNGSTTQKTSVFLGGDRVDLDPQKFEPLDNTLINEASKLGLQFPDLRVVDDLYIKGLLNQKEATNDARLVAGIVTTQLQNTVNAAVVNSNTMNKPSIQAILNSDSEVVSVYNLPVFNSEGVLIGQIGVQYNEEANTLAVSSPDIQISVINRKKAINTPVLEVKEVVNTVVEKITTLDNETLPRVPVTENPNIGKARLAFDATTGTLTSQAKGKGK